MTANNGDSTSGMTRYLGLSSPQVSEKKNGKAIVKKPYALHPLSIPIPNQPMQEALKVFARHKLSLDPVMALWADKMEDRSIPQITAMVSHVLQKLAAPAGIKALKKNPQLLDDFTNQIMKQIAELYADQDPKNNSSKQIIIANYLAVLNIFLSPQGLKALVTGLNIIDCRHSFDLPAGVEKMINNFHCVMGHPKGKKAIAENRLDKRFLTANFSELVKHFLDPA